MLTTADYVSAPSVAADERIAYGPGRSQFGDLYLPPGTGPHDIVVLLHGGCWLSEYGLEPVGGLARRLADETGLAVWNLEYRRLGEPGGGWPGTFLDVADGVDALEQVALKHPIRLDRVVVAGHSAGGHLALWCAARGKLSRTSPVFRPVKVAVSRVVALAPLADLVAAADRSLCGGAARQLLDSVGAGNITAANPAALLPLGVPQMLIAGKQDPIVPPDFVRNYAESARRAGDTVTVVELEKSGHFEMVFASSAAWAEVRRAFAVR